MQVSVLHVTDSIKTGAGRAALRTHLALRKDQSVCSYLLTNDSSHTQYVDYTMDSKLYKVKTRLKRELSGAIANSLYKDSGNILHSLSLFSNNLVSFINKLSVDIVHIHWVQWEMLSIGDIRLINKPIIWTLHDMWPMCATEHYTDYDYFRTGYFINRQSGILPSIVDMLIFRHKRLSWNTNLHFISPSTWMYECASSSILLQKYEHSIIHYPIDTTYWRPLDKVLCRDLCGLSVSNFTILFASSSNVYDERKGFRYLLNAIEIIFSEDEFNIGNLNILVLGPAQTLPILPKGCSVYFMGYLADDLSMLTMLNSADVLAVPSLQDNLPNIAIEAQSCGVPVVAFRTGGLSDIVEHHVTGALVDSRDTYGLAKELSSVSKSIKNGTISRRSCRRRAEQLFSSDLIVSKLYDVYRTAHIKNR